MRFDVVTIFPEFFDGPFRVGLLGRAREAGRIELTVHDLRDFADPPRRQVDDVPFGGGAGMVYRVEPAWRAVEAIRQPGVASAVVMPSPAGEPLDQALVRELGEYRQVLILCDRYEGPDERIGQLATHQVAVGDFVMSGGEPAALAVCDAVARLVPGVVGDAESVRADSFVASLLDHGHYTRPASYRGLAAPEVLVSGHHARIAAWRRGDALRRTLERRPDLLDGAPLDAEVLNQLERERRAPGIPSTVPPPGERPAAG